MKELSQIKPGLAREAAKQAVFESSLTHIKYKHQGDESSTNLVALDSLGNYAINKSGGVFTGPVQFKTSTTDIVNVTSVNGLVTINLGFGKFFRLNLLEEVYFIEIINAPTDAAITFTLILAQESSIQRFIEFKPSNDKVIKYYPNVFLYRGDFVTLGPFPNCRDIVTFSSLDGTTFFLSLTGLNYSGGGNVSYGTFIRNETNYITIDNVQYANGTVDIIADGNGGETTGTYYYPPNYPETGYIEFKSEALPGVRAGDILPAQIFEDLGNSNFNEDSMISMGGYTLYSDGQGGYREVVVYYGSEASFGQKDIYVDVNGVSTFMGFRKYVGDGLGGATIVYSYEYENGEVIVGPIEDTSLVFADDGQWYSIDYFYGYLPSIAFGGTFTIKANGFETITERTYPEEGTVFVSYPRYLGSALDYSYTLANNYPHYKPVFAPANLVADGTGKVVSQVTVAPGAFLPIGVDWIFFYTWNNNDYSQFPSDIYLNWTAYNQIGCSSCAPVGMPAPPCYHSDFEIPHFDRAGCYWNSYAARAIYDPTKWTASTAPPVGQGYFRIEIMPSYTLEGEYYISYDYITNPDNIPWVELPPISS
jgi:hypothetical protein